MLCIYVDDQSCRYFDGEETRQAATPHHAHHGLRAHSVPEETRSGGSGPRAAVPETVVERVAQG